MRSRSRIPCAAIAGWAALSAAPAEAHAARDVMGFLPSWERDAALRWDVLDVVAYFSVGVGPDGSLSSANGWPDDPQVAELIARAEAEGKRAVLTVTNFETDEISSLVHSAEARDDFIDAIVPLVLDAGGHGINIDLERVAAADREAYILFVTEVAAAFHNAAPDSHVSVAVPAIDWSGVFDAAALLEAADALFIMGYDYHWRGGSIAGPVAPLSSGTLWDERFNLGRTIADYAAQIPPADSARLILGLPLYGYDWPADSNEAPAATQGAADSVFFRDWSAGVEEDDILWDAESATPWYAYEIDGQWRQVWSEDSISIAAKLDLAVEHDLGIGFWALGYADGDSELWDVVAERAERQAPPPPDAGPDPGPGPGADAGTVPPDAGTGAGADVGGSGCAAGGRGAGEAGGFAVLGALALIRGRRQSTR